MAEPLIIAIVGAESTGKTQLAAALAERLARERGLRATWVPEHLRQWCDRAGRTPLQHEQAAIAAQQTASIAAAARDNDLVVCDTTALMTAVYSRIVFGDRSLDAGAAAAHRACHLTLLTALDLPWQPDGLQRDGPHVREPVDALLRELMAAHGLAWLRVGGLGEQRLRSALAACAPLWPGADAIS